MRSKRTRTNLKGGSSRPRSKSRNEVLASKVAQSYMDDFVKKTLTEHKKEGKSKVMEVLYDYISKEYNSKTSYSPFLSLQKKLAKAISNARYGYMVELGWGTEDMELSQVKNLFDKFATKKQKHIFPAPTQREFYLWSKMTEEQRDALRKDTKIRTLKLLIPLQFQKTKIAKYLKNLNMTNLKRKLSKRRNNIKRKTLKKRLSERAKQRKALYNKKK